MEKKKDEMPDWLAIPIIGVGLAIWYASESPENYQQVMTWVNVAADIIRWATEPQADIPVQAVAPAIASTGLSAIAQIGLLIGALMIGVVVFAAFSDKMKGGSRNATMQAGEAPTKAQPVFKADRSVISRNGARKVE